MSSAAFSNYRLAESQTGSSMPRLRLRAASEQASKPAQRTRSGCRFAALVAPTSMLGGCSTGSAPAVILFGAYFPDWLVFAILAVLFAIATRVVFGIAGRAEAIPYPLFTCLAVGFLIAGVIQLLWLGR